MELSERTVYFSTVNRWNESSSDVWSECSLREKMFLDTQRYLDCEIVPVSVEKFVEKAERARSEICRMYSLHKVNLNGTKEVEIRDDTPYRMWYPSTCPLRLPKEQVNTCQNLESTKKISTLNLDWNRILGEPDLIDEIRMRNQRLRLDLVLAPLLRRRLIDIIRRNYEVCNNNSYKINDLDCFARAEVGCPANDILKQCLLYYPDTNYEKEKSRLCEVLTSKFSLRAQLEPKLEIAVPGTLHAVAIENGGLCEILWKDNTLSIVTNIAMEQNIDEYVKWYFPKAIHARRLTSNECFKLSKYLDKTKAEVFDKAVRIYFASWIDCCDALKNKDHRVARLFPRAFVVANDEWNIAKNARMTYRLKWFKNPSTSVGVVILNDPRDQIFAKRVLFYHGYAVELHNEGDVNNVKIVLRHLSHSFQHDAIFKEHICEMLAMNNISVNRVYLKRVSKLANVDDIAQGRVFRSIIEELIRKRQWHGNHPTTRQEWAELLRENHPWQWKLLNNKCNIDSRIQTGEAELTFDDVECGLRVLDMLTNDERELKILGGCGDHSQRIVVKPVYCIPIYVTKEVRVSCDKIIRSIDEQESEIARNSGCDLNSLEIVDKTWTSDYDALDDLDTSEGEISVQGWPIRHVEEVAMRLMSVFHGRHIDCSDAINNRLLYGYGAKYVEYVRRELRGRVVIDVDLLGERITVVGVAAMKAIEKLTFFAENSDAFTISERIDITPPRYLHFMKSVLAFIGFDVLRGVCGGAKLKIIGSTSIAFTGTLRQYDLLISCLDEIDQKLNSCTSELNNLSKPHCPVCQSPVSNAFYCLECGHYYCLKCIIYQIKTVTKNRMLPIRCLHVNCDKPFSVNDIKRLVLGDARLPWLSAKKVDSLLSSAIDCLLRVNKSLFRCPSPDCYGIFAKMANAKPLLNRCDSCKREWCTACYNEPHHGVSCDDYALLRSDHAASLRAYKAEHSVRDCPTEGCGAVIEKDGGCNHMHCTVCNIHFCWLCDFMDKSQSDVYKHLRDEHGTIDDEWLFLEDIEFEDVNMAVIDEDE